MWQWAYSPPFLDIYSYHAILVTCAVWEYDLNACQPDPVTEKVKEPLYGTRTFHLNEMVWVRWVRQEKGHGGGGAQTLLTAPEMVSLLGNHIDLGRHIWLASTTEPEMTWSGLVILKVLLQCFNELKWVLYCAQFV